MNGIYINGKDMSIDIPEMLRSMGLPDTEANRDTALEMAYEAMREQGLISEETKVAFTHKHRCVRCQKDWSHDGKRTKCILPKYAQCQSCKN